jgi:hypothetical protein
MNINFFKNTIIYLIYFTLLIHGNVKIINTLRMKRVEKRRKSIKLKYGGQAPGAGRQPRVGRGPFQDSLDAIHPGKRCRQLSDLNLPCALM